MTKTLFLVAFSDEDGGNRDVLTYADTPEEAYQLWNQLQAECEFEHGLSGELVLDDGVFYDDNTLRIYQVAPDNGTSRALKWHTEDMTYVGYVEMSS